MPIPPDVAPNMSVPLEEAFPGVRGQIEQLIGYIPIEEVRDAKLAELSAIDDIHLTREGLPQIQPEPISQAERTKVREKGIEPTRYKKWLNALLPSDRPLARKMIDHIEYIDESALREAMITQFALGLEMARGDSLLWVGVSRHLSPHGGHLHRDWPHSGYRIASWYEAFLLEQGFTERLSDTPPPRGKYRSASSPYITVQEKHIDVYLDGMQTWVSQGNAPAVQWFERNAQRVAVVPGNCLIRDQAVSSFLTENGRSMGSVVIGEDWSLSNSFKSNVSEEMPGIITKYQSLIEQSSSLILAYGRTTAQGRTNIEQVISTSGCDSQKVIKAYSVFPTIPTIGDVFSSQERNSIIEMAPYKYLHMSNYQWYQEKMPHWILTHSDISVPDHIPNVMMYGPWAEIALYPLMPHPSSGT